MFQVGEAAYPATVGTCPVNWLSPTSSFSMSDEVDQLAGYPAAQLVAHVATGLSGWRGYSAWQASPHFNRLSPRYNRSKLVRPPSQAGTGAGQLVPPLRYKCARLERRAELRRYRPNQIGSRLKVQPFQVSSNCPASSDGTVPGQLRCPRGTVPSGRKGSAELRPVSAPSTDWFWPRATTVPDWSNGTPTRRERGSDNLVLVVRFNCLQIGEVVRLLRRYWSPANSLSLRRSRVPSLGQVAQFSDRYWSGQLVIRRGSSLF